MGRKSKRCPKQCKIHRFSLNPVHYSAVFCRELSASFCRSCLRAPSITPRFNKDNLHFTNSFILPVDNRKIHKDEEYYRTEHEKYKVENGMEKSMIYIAKPRAKSSYCNVCKMEFDDYLEHIKDQQHKKNIKENRFDAYVHELSHQINAKYKEENTRNQENRFQHFSETNLPFFNQENTHFEEKSSFQHQQNDYLQGAQYRQINNLMHSAKNFQLVHENFENGFEIKQNNDGLPNFIQYSPTKRPSQHMEVERNIKPIIIGGAFSLIH